MKAFTLSCCGTSYCFSYIINIWLPLNPQNVNLFIALLQVSCIVFDKTGTLTIGKPLVVNTKLLTNMVLQEFYELVAAAEVGITFPGKLRLHPV